MVRAAPHHWRYLPRKRGEGQRGANGSRNAGQAEDYEECDERVGCADVASDGEFPGGNLCVLDTVEYFYVYTSKVVWRFWCLSLFVCG